MRYPLRRFYGRGDLHFITFSCYRRRPFLGTPRARHHFVKILDQVRTRYRFLLIGYVVMPEHIHLLLSEPKKGNPSKVLQVLKQKVSRALRKRPKKPLSAQLQLPVPRSKPDTPAFWQRRFYDFNVWSDKKLREKLDYMHRNPVQRKLVVHPKDWPWSSWSHYEKGEIGLIRIDILGEEESRADAVKPKRPKRQNPKNQNQKGQGQNPHP
jgi:putative transposase